MIPFRDVAMTGGGGFIASHLAAELEAGSSSRVRLIDVFSDRAPSESQRSRITRHHCSVLDRQCLTQALAGADLVIHMAAIPATRLDEATRRLSIETSIRGTENVIRASNDVPLVIFSSAAVYGIRRRQDLVETRPVPYSDALEYDGGQEGYACGKFLMEEMSLRAAERGRPVMIIRPVNVVGPGQDRRHGGVIPTFFECALRHQPLKILGGRRESRFFSDVDVLCKCIVQLIGVSDAFLSPVNVINVGCDRKTRIIEMAEMILRMTGSKSAVQICGDDLDDPYEGRTLVLDRLHSLIGRTSWPAMETTLRKIHCADFRPSGAPVPA